MCISWPELFHLPSIGLVLSLGMFALLPELFISCFIPKFCQLYPKYRLLKWCVPAFWNSWKAEWEVTLSEEQNYTGLVLAVSPVLCHARNSSPPGGLPPFDKAAIS